MKSLFKHIFTWWNDYTLGTKLFTMRQGIPVGEDEEGNIYYRSKKHNRRWVIYNGVIEATRIPPQWHAWLHRLTDTPPSEQPLDVKDWQAEHRANPSGTADAVYPSAISKGHRPHATGDYEAWQPNS